MVDPAKPPAAALPDDATHAEKQARLERLQAQLDSQALAISRAMVGTTQRVLVERPSKRDARQLAGFRLRLFFQLSVKLQKVGCHLLPFTFLGVNDRLRRREMPIQKKSCGCRQAGKKKGDHNRQPTGDGRKPKTNDPLRDGHSTEEGDSSKPDSAL